MRKNRTYETGKGRLRRAMSGALAFVLTLGLLPVSALPARAVGPEPEAQEHWAAPYMEKLVGWGIMRGDMSGSMDPDQDLTRAEFVALMNRAYGYSQTAGTPFTDVEKEDWYAEDIDIAYNAGYFSGTSETTASPQNPLTREQAAVLLARNMMLREAPGEVLDFTDGRDFSSWSRNYIRAIADMGVISGNPDGSFHPQSNVTRGQVAAMLVRALGTPINSRGTYTLGSVYGNVTVNTSGVTLRNSVILGNLYLTGGIGLGDVLLENVDVLGQIIVSGAGESSASRSSVLLRNVSAHEMIVDSFKNQFVTLRAEGNTDILSASVRTNAYMEDATTGDYGLRLIELDGEPGLGLQVAGNIKEVVNLTPTSNLEVVQGVARKVTVDERAVSSRLSIASGARINELNLDTATTVTGEGDIDTLNVGAAGCTVSMLPDNINIRPGITASINNVVMDNNTAAEASAEPRLLAGYPAVRDVGPNTATLVFSGNKAGTVHWAITAVSDGSVSEENLLTPPSYGATILKAGTVNLPRSKTEYTVPVTGLTSDGSYYVTAIMTDARDDRSPIKVTAFTTVDDTVPAFTTGYPVISRLTSTDAQVTVMTNKSCRLYYVLLPKGSTTPTPEELKSGSVTGNLGYGVLNVVKNNTQPINVNRELLEEQTEYDLYLWLTDYDNVKSSTVQKLTFKTLDGTPPRITDIMQTDADEAEVEVTYTMSEVATFYWAIVVQGDKTFMNYDLDTVEARVKLESGVGAIDSGSVPRKDAGSIDIRGLDAAKYGTSFTVYYMAKDEAGNYSAIGVLDNVRTLDGDAPTVIREFTRYNDDDPDAPLADTDIRLVFSESVQGGPDGEAVFLDLYADVEAAALVSPEEEMLARDKMAEALHNHIKLYYIPTTGRDYEVTVRNSANADTVGEDWVIDFRYARIGMEDTKMVITFPTTDDDDDNPSALNLDSGAAYYFRVEGIYDTALSPNAMGNQNLPEFRTVFAQVSLSVGDTWTVDAAREKDTVNADGTTTPGRPVTFTPSATNDPQRIDIDFIADPISVDRVDEGMRWDMLLWVDTTMSFTLYSRPVGTTTWTRQGSAEISVDSNEEDGFAYLSLTRHFLDPRQTPTFQTLKEMKETEFGIHIDRLGDSTDFTSWNHTVNMRVSVVAGSQFQMNSLATGSFLSDYNAALADKVASIGTPDPFNIRKPFTDSKPPEIVTGWPTIELGDVSAKINVMLDRPGRIYYVIFPLSSLTTSDGVINNVTTELTEELLAQVNTYSSSIRVLDEDGTDVPKLSEITKIGDREVTTAAGTPLSLPTVNMVTTGTFTADVIKDATPNVAANAAAVIDLQDKLSPNTAYLVCMVTRGLSAVYSDQVVCYRFTTLEAIRPIINLSVTGGSTVNVTVDRTTELDFFLAVNGSEGADFQKPFDDFAVDGWSTDDTYSFNYDPAEDTGNTAGTTAGMTVRAAMATPCYAGQEYVGSVFDMYATTDGKNTYAALIRSQSVSGNEIVMTGSKTVTVAGNNGTENRIPCENMVEGPFYTFLAVGKSSEGSGDSFRAYYPVTLSDTKPPMIVNAINGTDYNVVTNEDGSTSVDHTRVTGTITLVFDEKLYAVQQGSTTQRTYLVDNCAMLATGHPILGTTATDEDGEDGIYMALGSLITSQGTPPRVRPNGQWIGGSGLSVRLDSEHDADTAGTGITAVTLYAVNAKSGDAVTFSPRTICDQPGNGLNRRPLVVTLRIVSSRVNNGTTDNPDWVTIYDTVIEISEEWDGR